MSAVRFLNYVFVAVLLVISGIDMAKAGSSLSLEQLEEGLHAARDYLRKVEELETESIENEKNFKQSSHDTLYARFKPINSEAIEKSKEATLYSIARKHLSQRYGIPIVEIDFTPLKKKRSIEDRAVSCDPNYKYRSFDGSCNNLNNPTFGQAGTPFQHIYSTNGFYQDGASTIRKSASGSDLPSPRLVSTTVVTNENLPDYDATLLIMQWGQFMDHDLTLTPTATANGQAINCCSGALTGALSISNSECLPITIPGGDPFFTSATCMNFVRSIYDGTQPTRQQINTNTHWIDGSHVYGSSDATAAKLRDKSSGRGLLATSTLNGRKMLPLTTTCCPNDPTNSCPAAASCFIAGDVRVTEQPLLTIMHTLFVREHNRVANALFNALPGKTDEFYFQEARRIVIAELQEITYTEYLPVLVGPNNAQAAFDGASSMFPDPNVNPAVYNEFAAAAYRMGHSQLKSFIRLYEADNRRSNQSYFLSDSFLSGSKLLNPSFFDNALRGLTRTPVQAVDNCFADDITSQLFKQIQGTSLGLDLVSLNIQRGRDHGLIPYVKAIAAINGGSAPPNFDALSPVTPPEVVAYFKSIYNSIQDIDLFIGGVTETPVTGGLVGPLFANIITRQFALLKATDRFFYADPFKSVSFNSGQLNEIKKISLARIICDNSDGTITKIQPRVFEPPFGSNSPVPCSNIPGINFFNYVSGMAPAGK